MDLTEEQREARTSALKFAREDFTSVGREPEEDAVLARAEKYRAFLDGDAS